MVKAYFPNKLDYQRFMGYYSSTVGSVLDLKLVYLDRYVCVYQKY